MRLYKYRDLRSPHDGSLARLEQLLVQQAFWAARPDTLNDATEFRWTCDFAPTHRTRTLLAEVLYRFNDCRAADAIYLAHVAVEQNRVEAYAAPALRLMQDRCRDETGLVCFGRSGTNSCLWQRYGGGGVGVCIELEVAVDLVGHQIRPVTYGLAKSLHIDQVLEASLDGESVSKVYELALLTKPSTWAEEGEFRFVSRQQGVSVRLNNSPVVSVTLGCELPADVVHSLHDLLASLNYPVELRRAEA